jgi:hypothetical protein
MDNRPSINLELLIPILIGGISVIGIVVVLVIGRALNSPAEITATPSETPFQYVYLGTEPAVTTLIVEESDLPPTEEPVTEEPVFDTPIILPARTATGNALRTSTPGRTPTRTGTPSVANTYDDTDPRIIYGGSWVAQTSVSGAYQNTLHISNVLGDSVIFTFTGTEIRFFYQAGSSLGTVTIFIDDDTLGTAVNEAQGGEWAHTLDAGTHTILIKHTGGGSVNIDRLVIPAPTATPTRTPTP